MSKEKSLSELDEIVELSYLYDFTVLCSRRVIVSYLRITF